MTPTPEQDQRIRDTEFDSVHRAKEGESYRQCKVCDYRNVVGAFSCAECGEPLRLKTEPGSGSTKSAPALTLPASVLALTKE